VALRAGVEVHGLKELRRDLRKIDPALQKELRTDLLEVGKAVAADAQSEMPVRTGRAKGSVKAGMSGNNAYVQGGKTTVPYFGWLDFGGVLRPTGGRRNTITREVLKKGRYLYPAIDRNADRIKQGAEDAVEKAIRKSF
jgi:hypothetical protein